MEQSPNMKVVSAYLDSVAKGDIAGVAEMLHDDLVWWIPGGEIMPKSGNHGKDQILKFQAQGFVDFPDGLVLKVTSVVEQDDKVAFEAEGYGVTTEGLVYANTYHMQMTIKDGRIFRCREHMDTAYIQAVRLEKRVIAPSHD